MDFTYPPEAEGFRKEFRAWLDQHLTDDLRELAQHAVGDDPERIERLRSWHAHRRPLCRDCVACEYGGRGASLMEQVVYAEEMHRAGAPGTVNIIGLSNIAPRSWSTAPRSRSRRCPPHAAG